MFGRETYTKLERRSPKYMLGLRLAEREGPKQIGRRADAERASMLHPVRGGATRNEAVFTSWPGPTTQGPDSIVPPKRSPWLPLILIGGVLWLAQST
jgi:hypothetical protein